MRSFFLNPRMAAATEDVHIPGLDAYVGSTREPSRRKAQLQVAGYVADFAVLHLADWFVLRFKYFWNS